MMMINGVEIAEHETQWAIRNKTTGQLLDCPSREQAEYDSLLYPDAEVVHCEAFYSPWEAS